VSILLGCRSMMILPTSISVISPLLVEQKLTTARPGESRPVLGDAPTQRDHVSVRKLPSGTVTLLFTDIEGSTRLLDELGQRYAQVLAEHYRTLREVFSRHGGVEVNTGATRSSSHSAARATRCSPRKAFRTHSWTDPYTSGSASTPASRS
jgi:Adenylate and Guanylate cyclase catalytic domain